MGLTFHCQHSGVGQPVHLPHLLKVTELIPPEWDFSKPKWEKNGALELDFSLNTSIFQLCDLRQVSSPLLSF